MVSLLSLPAGLSGCTVQYSTVLGYFPGAVNLCTGKIQTRPRARSVVVGVGCDELINREL